MFEVVGQYLASTASSFTVLHPVEEGFEEIVGAGDDADCPSHILREGDHVAPERVLVLLEVFEHDVDGLPSVLGRPAFRTPLAE